MLTQEQIERADKVYAKHRVHFAKTAASAIMDKRGNHLASITIKYPAYGGEYVNAYVHWIGTQMQRGKAGGMNYDKTSAAVGEAAQEIDIADIRPEKQRTAKRLVAALIEAGHGGNSWDRELRACGFVVVSVI